VISDVELLAAVEARAASGLDVMRFVHAHPELGQEERARSAFIARTLAVGGLEVERAAGGMETVCRPPSPGCARAGRWASSASTTLCTRWGR
jgi:metal-dependent amidase/aminoacylase/carboxypeptidase family protein